MKEKASNDFSDVPSLNDSMVVVEECGEEEMESTIQAQVLSLSLIPFPVWYTERSIYIYIW